MALTGSLATRWATGQASGYGAGARAILPALAALGPFALAVGALAQESGAGLAGWSTSWILYGGSAQAAFLQATMAGAPLAVVVATVVVVNLRLAFFGPAVAPHWGHASLRLKALAAYVIVDPTIAATGPYYAQARTSRQKLEFCMGAGFTLWAGWLVLNAIGMAWGRYVPHVVPMHLPLLLALIGLAAPRLRNPAAAIGAIVAAPVAWFAVDLSPGAGVLVAGCLAVTAALIFEEARK